MDILISDKSNSLFIDDFINYLLKIADEVMAGGPHKWSFDIEGIQVDVRIIPDDSWAFALLHFTGPMEENIRLRRQAKLKGLSLSEYGFKATGDPDDELLTGSLTKENEIYNHLELLYKAPNER